MAPSRIIWGGSPKNMNPNNFPIDMTPEEIRELLERCNAIWMYDGDPDPQKPHARLSSRLCSNGFFECSRALCFPPVCQLSAQQLSFRLTGNGVKRVDFVIGVPNGANTLAFEVAKTYNASYAFAVKERDPANPSKERIVWRGMTLPFGAVVLLVEDAITTGGSVRRLRQAIKEGNEHPVNIVDVVGVIVHRPPELPVEYDDMRVVSLLEMAIQTFQPEECPYCKAGSVSVRPKNEWDRLTGQSISS